MADFIFQPVAGATAYTLYDRTLPDSGSSKPEESGEVNPLNLFLIVGMALVITVLARFLAGRGRRK